MNQRPVSDVLVGIARCPEVQRARKIPGHPCKEVVESQDPPGTQVPEPWNGDITIAPLMFIGSNPSYDPHEEFPSRASSDRQIVEFFQERFEHWIEDGVRPIRQRDAGAKGNVRYLVEVRAIAEQAYRRSVIAGQDYVLSELVHCKSRNNQGVEQAGDRCQDLWLRKVLAASAARVVVVLGSKPGRRIRRWLSVPEATIMFHGCERWWVFLGAPGSSAPRRLDRVLTDEQREVLNSVLTSTPCT